MSWRKPALGDGHLITPVDRLRLPPKSTLVGSVTVSRYLDADDLIDAQGVAELLGLAQRNTVSAYQRRYPAMPRPVVDLGKGRCKLWLRGEIKQWRDERLESAGR